MARNVLSLAQIDALLARYEPGLRKAFLQAIADVANNADFERVVDAMNRGDIANALRAVHLDAAAFRPLDRAVAETFTGGGVASTDGLPTLRDPSGSRLVVGFNVRNPDAEAWLQNHSAELVREIVDDQRQAIRETLTTGMARGVNPRSVALDLVGRRGASGSRVGGVVGLTSSQADWVRAYRDELAGDNPLAALERKLRDKRFDRTVRRYAKLGEPIPAELREKMVAAYKSRALRFRAEALARTEAMAALGESRKQAMQQAVASGALREELITKVWRSARDKRVRDTHAAMDGQVVKLNEKFRSPGGALLDFPGDPSAPVGEVVNCRCAFETHVDFLAGIA